MLNNEEIEALLDSVLQRPLDRPSDATMVQKQQLVRLVKLGYNRALADAKVVFDQPGAINLGAVLAEALDNLRVVE